VALYNLYLEKVIATIMETSFGGLKNEMYYGYEEDYSSFREFSKCNRRVYRLIIIITKGFRQKTK